MTYTCPVCGYTDLPDPPLDMSYEICPSCGTEFGHTDFATTHEDRDKRHEELRAAWMRRGFRWHAEWLPQPENWAPRKQLLEYLLPTTGKSRLYASVRMSPPVAAQTQHDVIEFSVSNTGSEAA
jgi:hypothetical protein